MQPTDWAEVRACRRAYDAKPENICGRVYDLLDALTKAEKAEGAVDMATDHPKWAEFCAALDSLDLWDVRRRLKVFADAWQDEIDSAPDGDAEKVEAA